MNCPINYFVPCELCSAKNDCQASLIIPTDINEIRKRFADFIRGDISSDEVFNPKEEEGGG